jgi:hypothetical protein
VTDLDRQWAQTQVEAFVAGNLPPEAERRMRAVMEDSPDLRKQVECARLVRRELRSLRSAPVPGRLFWSLLGIPGRDRAPRLSLHMPATVMASVAAVAIGVGSYSIVERHKAEAQARETAVRDFQVAMVYLQKSTALANSEVTEAVGLGVRSAVNASRSVLQDAQGGVSEGEQDDVD